MMKKKILSKLKQAHDGAAVLMVLLVTVFVVMMGSSVIFSSHNGYLVQLVDRAGMDTFYSAEDYLVQAKAVVQDMASDALQTSYTRVMSEYGLMYGMMPDTYATHDELEAAAEEKFHQYFLDELNKIYVASDSSTSGYGVVSYNEMVSDVVASGGSASSVMSMTTSSATGDTHGSTSFVDGTNEKLFYFYDLPTTSNNVPSLSTNSFTTQLTTKQLNGGEASTSDEGVKTGSGIFDASLLGALAGMAGVDGLDMAVADGTTGGKNTGYFELLDAVGGRRLVMKDVMISYVDDSGFQSYITTDFIIEMPDFVHNGDITTGTGLGVYREGTALDNAASIGKLWVKVSSPTTGGLLVAGDMYGGTFYTYQEGSNDISKIIFSHGGGRLITHTEEITKLDNPSVTDDYNDQNANFITGTTKADLIGFEIYDGTTFFSRYDSEIWTSNVSLYSNGNMYLQGYGDFHTGVYSYSQYFGGVNVLGDIIVEAGDDSKNGSGESNVTMTGDIFGFGNGSTAAESSAILISTDNVNLNMEYEPLPSLDAWGNIEYDSAGNQINMFEGDAEASLRSITMAGLSYLDPAGAVEGIVNSEYAMGQSMAVVSDQLAYLIPVAAMSNVSSNPTGLDISSVVVDTSYVLWGDKTLADYGISSVPYTIKRPYSSGDTATYYLYNFDVGGNQGSDTWVANANAYFADYVEYNGEYFEEITSKFVTIAALQNQMFSLNSKGSIYYMSDDGIKIGDNSRSTSESLDTSAAIMQQRFENASVTLSPDIAPVATNDYKGNQVSVLNNPFDYYLHCDLLLNDCILSVESGIWGSIVFRRDTGDKEVLAIFRNSGFNYYGENTFASYANDVRAEFGSTSASELSLIIARAGVGLNAGTNVFNGLVMSETGVALQSPIYSNADRFQSALDAKTMIYVMNGTAKITKNSGETDAEFLTRMASDSNVVTELSYRTGATLGTYNDGTDTYLIMNVPASAYFRNLGNYSEAEPEEQPFDGAGEIDTKVNWAAEDLVYFENWEKH